MTTAGFDAVTTRTLFAFGGEHLEAVYKTTEFLFLSHLFLAISDLFRNGIAALCAATRSHAIQRSGEQSILACTGNMKPI